MVGFFFQRKHASHVDRYDVLTAPRKRKAKNQDAPSTFRQLKLGETKIVSQRNVDHAVLNFVIQSLQLFSVVEQPSCQDLLQDLQPNASLMSRTTLWRKIDEDAIEMKRNIKEAMSTVDFIATTTDCWSARRRGFLGVTAHWVDPNSATIKCATKLQINVKWNNCSLVLLFHNHLVLPNGNR